MSTIGKNTTAR